jgi:AcrR family transcriptional regulator
MRNASMMQVIVDAKTAQSAQHSRERMVVSAAMLLREKGLTGTSFGDVIEHSGAPRGSIYHHFPGGKTQLVEDAVRYAGEYIDGTIDRAAKDGDPVLVLRAFTAAWKRVLEDSDFRAGCPVVAVAVEAHDGDSALTSAVADAFGRWQQSLIALLRGRGVPEAKSRRLATTMVASIEGAVVMCRATRSVTPLTDVGRELETLLDDALA